MNELYTVIYSSQALEDLNDIYNYSCALWQKRY